MTDAGTTQDNFILPAPPVGGLPISQDRLDRTKLIHDHTIPIILPRGKNILIMLAQMLTQILLLSPNLKHYDIPALDKVRQLRERERNVLFNDALNTFYLRLYGIRHMVKNHSDSDQGNPLPPHRLLLSINSKGSFICTIPQTG